MDNLGILVQAILSLKDTKASKDQIASELPKLESQLQSDKNTRVKIVAGLDIAKSKNLIQSQLNTLANQAKAPTIKVGIDTSGLNSVQGATQNITNGLKSVQTQAQQTASAVKQAFTNMTADDVSDKMVSQFQKSFYIVGKKATETKAQFKSLIAEFNNGWNTGNVDAYSKVLEDIYRLATQSTKATKGLDENIKQAAQEIRSTMTDGGKITIGKQLREDLKASLDTAGQIKQVLDTVYGVGKWKYASSSRKSFSGEGVFADEMVGSLKDSQSTLDAILSTYEALDKLPKNMTMFDHMDTETAKSEISKYLQEILKLPSAYQTAQSAETTYTQTAIQDVENLGAIADTLSKKLETIFMGGGQGSQPITVSAHWEKLADQANVASLAIDKIRTADSTTAESIKANAESEIAKLEQLLESYRNIEYAIEQQGVSANNFISNNQIQASFNSLKQAEEYFKNFNIGTVTFSSNKGELQHIKDFTINVKSLTGEIEHFKYVAYNDGDNQNPIWKYQLQNINASNEAVQRLIDSQNKYKSQVEATAISLKTQLSTIQSGYTDKNSAKYINNVGNQTDLANQYKNVESAIERIKTADQTTFASMKANAEAEIATLKNMVKQFQNAEYAANSLRTKGVTTTKKIETDELNRFINKINDSNVPINKLRRHIEILKSSLSNVTDSQSLVKYLDNFSRVEAKFNSLKALYQTIGGYDKQLDKLAQDWQKQGIYVGNVKTTIENLKASLANVNTSDGLTTWISDFNSQISNISKLPIEIAKYKQEITATRDEWKSQGIYVGEIQAKVTSLARSLPNIKKPEKFNEWVQEWNDINQKANQLKVNLDSQVATHNKIYEIQAQIAKLNPTKDTAEITRLNEKLALEQKTLSNLQMQSNVYSNLISFEQQEKYITEQTVQARDKLLSATNTGVKQYQTTITNAIGKLQGIANSAVFRNNASNSQVTQTKQDINSLITAYQNLATKLQGNITPAGLETVRTKLTQLNASFNDATTTAKRFETELRSDNGAEKQAQRVALLKAQLTALEKANPKAMKQYGDAIKSLMATLNNNPDARAIERVTKDIQLLRREINNANLAGKTLWQTFEEKSKKFIGWMSMTFLYSSMFRAFRSAITNVIELDKAMTNLKKVTDETDTAYAKFLNNASTQAKELHSTITDLVEQTAVWAKLGYSLNEAQNLATTSMIYSKVGEVENSKAVSDLVTVMKAFNIESEKSITIVDALNELGNSFATSAADLGEGLTKSASALQVANNSFEQSIALLTGGTEITQNANEMGSALKVISMRIRGKNICLRIRKVYTPCYA